MIKALIIEDEQLVARDLRKTIAAIDSEIEIIGLTDSVRSSVEFLQGDSIPDLIFCDIQLSDGVSFDIFNQVKSTAPVIFTTAYNEYAIRAFKVNGIDYLLKPIDRTELEKAILRFRELRGQQEQVIRQQLQSLLGHLALPTETKIYRERFSAHQARSFVIIDQVNISYIKKDTLIYIGTNDRQQFITDFQTMEEIEDVINPRIFFRANRQYIIHINAVESYKAESYGKLEVKLKAPVGLTVDISREKAAAFRQWLQ